MKRTNPLDVIRRRYDEFAPTYLETWGRLEGYSDTVTSFLAREATTGCRVLDLGCGPGHFTTMLPDGVQVVGLDLSPGMIARAADARPSGTWRVHDYYEPIPEDLGVFDVVVAVGALDFCEDIDAVLGHVAARTRSGGSLLVSLIERRQGVHLHEAQRLPITPERMPGVDLVFYTLAEMSAAFDRAGLIVRRHENRKGYHNQFHALDVGYAIWELGRATPVA